MPGSKVWPSGTVDRKSTDGADGAVVAVGEARAGLEPLLDAPAVELGDRGQGLAGRDALSEVRSQHVPGMRQLSEAGGVAEQVTEGHGCGGWCELDVFPFPGHVHLLIAPARDHPMHRIVQLEQRDI